MTVPYPFPNPASFPTATFTGMWRDLATGTWQSAQAVVTNGQIWLQVVSPAGRAMVWAAPASHVIVKSAAQRITLIFQGQSFPILADPDANTRGYALGAVFATGSAGSRPGMSMGMNFGRGLAQYQAAQRFGAQGGQLFLQAARASGAQVSRLGYGPLAAIGCGGGLLVVILITFATLAILTR